MKKNTKAFSLVELIIATIILTIGVFWVSALLTNTQNNINYLQEKSKKQSLYYSIFECFKSKKTLSILNNWENFWVDFWNNLKWCNVNLNWNTKTKINNVEYLFKAKVIEKQNSFAKIKITIDNDKWKIFEIF